MMRLKYPCREMRSSEAPVFKVLNLVAERAFDVYHQSVWRGDAFKINFVQVVIFLMIDGYDHCIVIFAGGAFQAKPVLMPELVTIGMWIHNVDRYMIALEFFNHISHL